MCAESPPQRHPPVPYLTVAMSASLAQNHTLLPWRKPGQSAKQPFSTQGSRAELFP